MTADQKDCFARVLDRIVFLLDSCEDQQQFKNKAPECIVECLEEIGDTVLPDKFFKVLQEEIA